MANRSLGRLVQHVRFLMGGSGGTAESDGQLLARFANHQDEGAFRLLLERYGPMVLGVCRRILSDTHDADDAFQATFLVLVRKAGVIQKQELVGNWLYGVALRIARRARQNAARRAIQRAEVPDMAIPGVQAETDHAEVRQLLDEELQHLPSKYRVPMILCYLEGRTNEATAQSLHCPPGTLKTRLAKGRELLRARLERRGVALSVGALTASLAPEMVNAAVTPSLADATIQAALLDAGGLGVNAVSASVAELMDGALREMLVSKLQIIAGLLLVLAAVGVGAGVLSYQAIGGPGQPVAVAAPEVAELPEVTIADGGLASSIEQRIRNWEPTRQERRFDEIGWAGNLAEARRLARQHGRPIFLLTSSASIETGRCPASAFNVRAGALSNDAIINLLNQTFVPVYLSSSAAAENADLIRLRQEAERRELSSRINQAWVLDANGELLDTLDACHAPADQLMKFLKALLEPQAQESRDAQAKPVVKPTRQSRAPQAKTDALVLHSTARYLERKDDDLVPQQVALGKETNYFMKGLPAEDWIVLERREWTRLLPASDLAIGQSWEMDRVATALLFRYMYPPSEDNDLASNRIDQGALKATIVGTEQGVTRASIEGSLRMKHRFDPLKDDNRFVTATLLGYIDFTPDRIRSLKLLTTDATYGKNPFGVALRSVP